MKKDQKEPQRSGSSFDSFLEEQGIRAVVEKVANSRVQEWQGRERKTGRGKQRPYGQSS